MIVGRWAGLQTRDHWKWGIGNKVGKSWERVRAGPDLKAVRKVWPQALLANTGQNKGERYERGRLGGGGEKVGNLRRESWEKFGINGEKFGISWEKLGIS